MVQFFSFPLTIADIIIFYIVAMFIGMAKTGVHGAGMAGVPLLAAVFGGQLSSGILLPILCFADVFGVWYYHRHASWPHLKKLFPWAIAGTIVGTIVGAAIDDQIFKMIMAGIIVVTILIMLWLEHAHKDDVPHYVWFAALMGVAGGFSSMVGNLAGSVMAVYFLSMRLPKNEYIGTTAWFFIILNFIKIPIHIWNWHTISINTFLMDLTTLPAIGLGAFFGIIIVRTLSEKTYRWFIIGMTLVAAVFMFL